MLRVEHKEVGDRTFSSVSVGRVDSKGKILSIEDACTYKSQDGDFKAQEKVILSATAYAKDVDTVFVKHYMDLDDFMVLAEDVLNCRPVDLIEYKGSKNDNYKSGYESRTLTVVFKQELGQGRGGYAISIRTGPGIAGESGAVMPDKSGTFKEVKLVCSIPNLRAAMMSASMYFRAKHAAVVSKLLPSA